MFIQVIQGRTSDPEALHRRLDVWERDLRPGAIGYLGSAGGCTADGSFIMAVRFTDRDAAMRNGARKEQGEWWSATEKCLDGPASFHDTEDVHVMAHGKLEDAHFVQVMEGHVTDRVRAEALEREADPVLAEARPDLLGSVTAYYDEDNYADFAYFTSEAEAREAEQREIPPALAEKFGEWEQLMKVDRYLDITEPWMIAGV
ncbi:MAG: hypothetical protein V9E94_09310 [Microthrixaceae bacterium]